MNAVKIGVQNICMVFDTERRRVEALKNVSFDQKENEFLVLLGPSGCGKTTVLNIVAGLLEPTEGQVLLDGKEIAGPGPDRGYVFQELTQLFDWKTVIKNVEFGPLCRGLDREERRRISEKYIDLVGLRGFEDSYPHELSGGMKQRVAIARVYANNPTVMLMDEPFANLDAQTRSIMQNELKKIWSMEKRTITFVTHSVEEAVYLGDRIIIMTRRPGRIKETIDVGDVLGDRKDHLVKYSEEFTQLKLRIHKSLEEEFEEGSL